MQKAIVYWCSFLVLNIFMLHMMIEIMTVTCVCVKK